MDWSAVIGGASMLLGNRAAKKQNKAAIAAAKTQMDFQERMSSTAHQREIKDLKLAGLNPILSGTGGRGASSPGGAMNPTVDELGPAMSTAAQVARTAQDLKAVKANTRKTDIEADAAFYRSTPDRLQHLLLLEGEKGVQSIIQGLTSSPASAWSMFKNLFTTPPGGTTQTSRNTRPGQANQLRPRKPRPGRPQGKRGKVGRHAILNNREFDDASFARYRRRNR